MAHQLLYEDDGILVTRKNDQGIVIQAKKNKKGPNDHGATIVIDRAGDGNLRVETVDQMVIATGGIDGPCVIVKRIG